MNKYQQMGLSHATKEFRGRSNFIVQSWWIIQKTLFAWSPQVLYGWRNFLLRLFGAKIGKNAYIRPSAQFTYPWKVTVGDYSQIGDEVVVYSLGEIVIGSHTVISQRTYLCGGSHDYKRISFDLYSKPIRIADQVWIGADVFVAPGIHIGEGTVVGARSTVLHDLPEAMVCFGNPAKPVKPREMAE
jgi:putative colanic acid biosynthesis acetyltransferase WcaF